jgi:hypothetical protein
MITAAFAAERLVAQLDQHTGKLASSARWLWRARHRLIFNSRTPQDQIKAAFRD